MDKEYTCFGDHKDKLLVKQGEGEKNHIYFQIQSDNEYSATVFLSDKDMSSLIKDLQIYLTDKLLKGNK